MPLEFVPERLETVKLLRGVKSATVRFSTRVLYFETLTRLREIVEQLSAEEGIETVYFESEGKNFLLGADVDYFYEAILAGRQDRIMTYSDLGNDLFDAIENLPFPTVAIVDGAALGGGFELALACSGRVATPGSSFAFPETGLGIFPGWGGIKRLQRRIGPALAKWIVFTGKSLPAPLAASLQILDVLAAPDQARAVAEQLARSLRDDEKRPPLNTIPDALRQTAAFFDAPLNEILVRTPSDREEKMLLASLKRQAPLSLQFAERIFDHARILPPLLERRFEDTLTWRIYHSPDAAAGLGHAHAGKMGKVNFSGNFS